jgi:hypothetical protein
MAGVASYDFAPADPASAVAARKRLVSWLKQCPAGRWISTSAFGEAIKSSDSRFLRSQSGGSMAALWNSDFTGGSWDRVEGVVIQFILHCALWWHGVLDLGLDKASGQPTSFRITEAGRKLLGLVEGPIPEPALVPITVQPNFEVVVPREAPQSVVYHLQRVAELGKRDLASLYILSQNAVWQDLQAGGDTEHTISFLEAASQRPLPQNVAYSLREWAAKYGELSLEPATLLRATSERLLAELKANKKLRLHEEEAISPYVLKLHQPDVALLVANLKKAGYWPKVERSINPERPSVAIGSTIGVPASDMVHLLVAAIVMSHINDGLGLNSPVSKRLIDSLSWQLAPNLLKQVQRLVGEAIARYESGRLQIDEGDE